MTNLATQSRKQRIKDSAFCHCCGTTERRFYRAGGSFLCRSCHERLEQAAGTIYGNRYAAPVVLSHLYARS